MSEENEKPKTGDVDIMDLVPCLGVGCCIFSMYTELPDCLGSVCNNVICCIACKIMTCKASKEPDVFCKCISTDCDIVPFSTCCKAQGQTFCIDMRVSFPPSDQIPCLLTLCCLTVRLLSSISPLCLVNFVFLIRCSAATSITALASAALMSLTSRNPSTSRELILPKTMLSMENGLRCWILRLAKFIT